MPHENMVDVNNNKEGIEDTGRPYSCHHCGTLYAKTNKTKSCPKCDLTTGQRYHCPNCGGTCTISNRSMHLRKCRKRSDGECDFAGDDDDDDEYEPPRKRSKANEGDERNQDFNMTSAEEPTLPPTLPALMPLPRATIIRVVPDRVYVDQTATVNVFVRTQNGTEDFVCLFGQLGTGTVETQMYFSGRDELIITVRSPQCTTPVREQMELYVRTNGGICTAIDRNTGVFFEVAQRDLVAEAAASRHAAIDATQGWRDDPTLPGTVRDAFRAAERGDTAILEQLLIGGVSPDAADQSGTGLLHVAAASGHLGVVEMLLNWAADAHRADDRQRCAYNYARAAGHEQIYTLLIDHLVECSRESFEDEDEGMEGDVEALTHDHCR